jgi:hypothetical protein
MVPMAAPSTFQRDAPAQGRLWLLALLGSAAFLAIFFAPPVAEPLALRAAFADERAFFGIPNFWNVISNVAFLLVSVWGLRALSRSAFAKRAEKWAYAACFVAVGLVSVGSTYFHLAPSDDRLMWDRLPMSLGFMALLSAVIAERVSVQAGIRALAPLLVAGAASVLYWSWSKDVLPYAIVQYGAIAAMVAIALFFPSRYTRGGDLLVIVAIYAAAKVAEMLDAPIYAFGEIVSGHTLKHLLAAVAGCWLVRMLELRRPLNLPS